MASQSVKHISLLKESMQSYYNLTNLTISCVEKRSDSSNLKGGFHSRFFKTQNRLLVLYKLIQ